MQTFVRLLFIFLLLCLLPFAGLFMLPVNTQDHLFSLLDKNQILQETVSPKIVLLGGSNLSFGINSKLLSDSLKMPVINMGIQASLGLKFITKEALPYINEGDIIVVAPEYEYFTNKLLFNGQVTYIHSLLHILPSGFLSMDLSQAINFCRYMPVYISLSYKTFISNQILGKKPEGMIFSRDSYNNYGDAVYHWDEKSMNLDLDCNKKNSNMIQKSVLKYLKSYKQSIEIKHAKFLFMYPAIAKTSYVCNESYIKLLGQELKKYDIPVVGNSADYAVPDRFVYNTIYHFIQPGVNLRTLQMIKDLKPYI